MCERGRVRPESHRLRMVGGEQLKRVSERDSKSMSVRYFKETTSSNERKEETETTNESETESETTGENEKE